MSDAENPRVVQFQSQRPSPENAQYCGGGGSTGGGPTGGSGTGERIAKLEGSFDSLKVVRPMTIGVLGLAMTILALAFSVTFWQLTQVTGQLREVNAKLDEIPNKIGGEFQAMRGDMSAQVTAIGSAVSAAKQGPQVIIVPASLSSPVPQFYKDQTQPQKLEILPFDKELLPPK
jgi:hypothetical protein